MPSRSARRAYLRRAARREERAEKYICTPQQLNTHREKVSVFATAMYYAAVKEANAKRKRPSIPKGNQLVDSTVYRTLK